MKTEEGFFKIAIEQDVLNNLVDNGKITIDEKYYHKRSIKLMKEAQEWAKQQALKDELDWLREFERLCGMTSITRCFIADRIKLLSQIKDAGGKGE